MIRDTLDLYRSSRSTRSSYRLFSALICLAALAAMPGHARAEGDGFYDRREEGFYFYKDDVAAEVPEQVYDKYFRQPVPDAWTYQQLWEMRPERLAEVVKARLDLALQKPTEQNAYSYYLAQDVAKQKSLAFSGVMGLVTQKNPKLTPDNNALGPGKQAYYELRREETRDVLQAGAQEFALIVFEAAGCGYCEAQRPIIDRFQELYGWSVKRLDIEQYKGLADRYGIEITPSILMISKESSEAIPISSGAISMSELQQRIMRAVRYLTGETKPEQWYKGVGVSDPLKNIEK